MKVRYVVILCCFLVVSCEALFGNLSEMNPNYCANRDSVCPAGLVCDEASHLCVPNNADGGSADGGNSDGGTNPALSTELFGAEAIPISLFNTTEHMEEGIMHRGDFDGNAVDDIFVMGKNRYSMILNPSTGSPTVTFGNYMPSGKDPEAAAVGRLNNDTSDDVAIGLLTNKALLVLMSGPNPIKRVLPGPPKGVAIGDVNGDRNNDVVVGLEDGMVIVYYGDGTTIENSETVLINPMMNMQNHFILRLIMSPYRKMDGSQDVLITYIDTTAGLSAYKLRILRGGPAAPFVAEDIAIGAAPTDVAVGRFSSPTSYDLAVVVGENDLDVIRGIEKPAPSKQPVSLSSYGVEATQPNRGKLATGQFLPASIAGQLDDLAVLHKDGRVSIFPGGASWASGPSFLASRSMLGEHIVAGRFARNSQRDDLVVNTDTGVGANLMVARNLDGNQFTMPFDFHRAGTGGPNSIVIGGSFGAVGSSDFVLLGGGGDNTAMRCGSDGNRGISCPVTKMLGSSVAAAAPLVCANQPTRLVVAYSDRSVALVDMTSVGAPGTDLGLATEVTAQLVVGDVDNDGSPDIVARGASGNLSIQLGALGSPCQFSGSFKTPTALVPTANLLPSLKVLLTDAKADSAMRCDYDSAHNRGQSLGPSCRAHLRKVRNGTTDLQRLVG